MHGDYFGWGMGGMAAVWIICLALVAAFVWLVVRLGNPPPANEASPEAILRRRYARGEVDRETYQRMLGDLKP
ncbi:MAG: SHOCT domain-containing protein [Rhodospirillaceae bacterium]